MDSTVALLPTRLAIAEALRTADTICAVATCGGHLRRIRGEYVHVNACVECVDTPVTQPCPVGEHRTCSDPEPLQCDHLGCHSAHTLETTCERGHLSCCGCCHYYGYA